MPALVLDESLAQDVNIVHQGTFCTHSCRFHPDAHLLVNDVANSDEGLILDDSMAHHVPQEGTQYASIGYKATTTDTNSVDLPNAKGKIDLTM